MAENNYRSIFDPFIKDVEGSSADAYDDGKGNPTVGSGINLNDEANQGILKMHGVDPESLKSGQSQLDPDTEKQINDTIVRNKEQAVRDRVGSDTFDNMRPNEQAAVMSMGYNSMNLLGPNMVGHIANNDPINAVKEMVLNSNPKDEPGVLARRLKEAELYADPIGFSQAMKTFSPDETQKVKDIINKNQNEGQKQSLLDKYGPYLTGGRIPASAPFPNLRKMIRTSDDNK